MSFIRLSIYDINVMTTWEMLWILIAALQIIQQTHCSIFVTKISGFLTLSWFYITKCGILREEFAFVANSKNYSHSS